MSSEPTTWKSASDTSFVAVTVFGYEDVYLLAHKRCAYTSLIAFVQERFSVSGEPECVWLERNGLKLKLALDLWNDYAGAFVGNKLVVQFPGVVNDAEGGEDTFPRGGLVLTCSSQYAKEMHVVFLYRDPILWSEASKKIPPLTMPRNIGLKFVVEQPYPRWWVERFGEHTMIEGEEKWEQIVNAALNFAPNMITDLQVKTVHDTRW